MPAPAERGTIIFVERVRAGAGVLLLTYEEFLDSQRVLASSKALQTHRLRAHHYRNPAFCAVAPK